MARRVSPFVTFGLLTFAASGLSSCGLFSKPQRPAWRTQQENACLAQQRVHASAYVQPANEMDGPGICGMTRPFKVAALQDGAVAFNSTATLDCPMVAELEDWLADVVQPAAQMRFGQAVTQINSMGSYSCRGMNGQYGAPLSEHSFGNAIDIGGFVLAGGREIAVVRDWTRGDEQTRAFLKDVHAGSCRHFSTVLSPGSNAFHYNHIHVDLAMHGRSGGTICKPTPVETVGPAFPAAVASASRAPAAPSFPTGSIASANAGRGAPVEDEDVDPGGTPPHAAFETEDRVPPLSAYEATPLPPRRPY
ncbi:MAG: extensin family protein [Methylocystis sp.]